MDFSRAITLYRNAAAETFRWPDSACSVECNGTWALRDVAGNPLAIVRSDGRTLLNNNFDQKCKANSFTRAWRRDALSFEQAAEVYSRLFDGTPDEAKSLCGAGVWTLIDKGGNILAKVLPDGSCVSGKSWYVLTGGK